MYYLVFSKRVEPPHPQAQVLSGPGGYPIGPGIGEVAARTIISPISIFRADRAEDACQAAAKKVGSMGTYFAIEGTPWGVDLIDTEGTTELGAEPPEDDEKERRIRALERGVLDKDVPE